MGEAGLICWLLGIVLFMRILQQIGNTIIKAKANLELYEEYMVFKLPRYMRYGSDNKERREKYFIVNYNDIKKCIYNTEDKYIDIFGKITLTYYELENYGTRKNNDRHTRYTDGILRFYICNDREEEYKKYIEEYCGIELIIK